MHFWESIELFCFVCLLLYVLNCIDAASFTTDQVVVLLQVL